MDSRYSRRDVIAISGAAVVGSATALRLHPEPALAQDATPTADMLRAPEADPQRGGTVRTAWGATTSHYDLHQGASSAVLANLYDLLVQRNLADGLRTIIPGLATSWEISDDGLTYTFTTREGVTFHDGEPFSAEDVAATFNRIIFPPEGIVSVYRSELGPVESVTALDPTTVEFVLSSPWPILLEVLTNPALVIYSKAALEANDQDLRREIAPGTGPFIVSEALPGEKFTYLRNENYWNPELPYVDQVEMLHVPVWTDRGTAVLTGQASFSFNVSPQTWDEGAARDDMGTARLPCLNSHTAMINNEHEPFNDPRVRRAIYLAVSKQNLIAAISATQEPVFLTTWMPSVAPYAPSEEELATRPGYRPEKEEDIAEAKRLMAEAGFPDGFGPIDLVTASDPQHSGINGPAVQEELRQSLGIESEIRLVERGLLAELYQSGDFDIIVEGAFASNLVDPTLLWNANLRTGASTNWSRYANEEFDALLDQIIAESDEAARQELFAQGIAMLDENPPFLLIGFCAHSAMWHASVKGLALEDRLFSQFGRFETVWLDQS